MDRVGCETLGCEATVAADHKTGFCHQCEGRIVSDRQQMQADIDATLQREAAFVAWCETHGLPHPHE